MRRIAQRREARAHCKALGWHERRDSRLTNPASQRLRSHSELLERRYGFTADPSLTLR